MTTGKLFLAGLAGIVALTLAVKWLGHAGPRSGDFDLSKHSIPLDRIISGGPGKDGVPALLHPLFVQVSHATFLSEEDRVLGLTAGPDAKAYPVKILNWHEIVNDTIGGKPVIVTYCPLCGTGIGFEADVQGQRRTFGVSGLLYQSDLLMYDHQTESLWSQIAMEAVAGPMTGAKLTPLFLVHTSWGVWKADHPTTLVLSPNTGHRREYNRDPYRGYAQQQELMFDVTRVDLRYHAKEWVLGVTVDGESKAYPFAELKKLNGPVTDRVNGRTLRVYFNRQARSAWVTDANGTPLPSVMAFWFAWYAFHPETAIFTAGKQ